MCVCECIHVYMYKRFDHLEISLFDIGIRLGKREQGVFPKWSLGGFRRVKPRKSGRTHNRNSYMKKIFRESSDVSVWF